MLVAPVTIGAGARLGAGFVVTHDVGDGVLAYGVPARPKKADSRTMIARRVCLDELDSRVGSASGCRD